MAVSAWLKSGILGTMFLLGIGMVCTLSGCANALGVMAYAIRGNEVDPPCDKMTGKVAIVCRPRAASSYQYSDVAVELGRSLNKEIGPKIKKPKKCQLISQQKIEEYCDGMESETDFLEIGKAVGADQVICIDLHSYNHVAGTNVWQGRAEYHVELLDVASGNVLYEPEETADYVFPKNSVISATDKREYEFQSLYLKRLSHHIGKNFVPYDRTEVDF